MWIIAWHAKETTMLELEGYGSGGSFTQGCLGP